MPNTKVKSEKNNAIPEDQQIYKYKINQLISKLPREITLENIIEALKAYGICQATFFRDKSLTATETKSIPVTRLDIYTILLLGISHSTDELKNYNLQQVAESHGIQQPKTLSELFSNQ